ncbi:hypothetical protein ABDK00_005685 [Niabella insulamsoli]|uniref:hypothetical protein n=1 Tax=Niabella insulamsoli TaxID=3144874 RepID=UPI0031FDD83D
MITTATGKMKILLSIFYIIAFGSCSSIRSIDKNANKLYQTLMGNWIVNSRIPPPEAHVAAKRTLPRGNITFYPNKTFMYKTRHQRYRGSWEIVVSGSQYPIYQLELAFADFGKTQMFTLFYFNNRKIKFKTDDRSVANVFTR